MDNYPNYFNQSYYQNIPSNEVNWAMLAKQWINHQTQPINDTPYSPWDTSLRQPPPPLNHYPSAPRAPYDPYYQQYPRGPPAYQSPQQQRMMYFNHQEMQSTVSRPRIPSLLDINIYRQPPPAPSGPSSMYSARPPPPQAPLFPSAQKAQSSSWRNPVDSQYDWPSEPPPPPPAPEWINSDVTGQDQPVLDNNEKKKLPEWIRQGLERMEKEKRMRQEKEEKRKLLEKIEKEREGERQNNGKSRFDSDDEEEVKPRRKFEEYPDKKYLSTNEKEQIKMYVLRTIISSILLKSTNGIIQKCCDEAISHYKAKQSAKVVVNKATAALTALAELGGDDSSEDETDNKPAPISRDNNDSKIDEKRGSRKSRSRSPIDRRRSKSPKRHNHDDRRKHSREDDHKSHHRHRSNSNGYRRSSHY